MFNCIIGLSIVSYSSHLWVIGVRFKGLNTSIVPHSAPVQLTPTASTYIISSEYKENEPVMKDQRSYSIRLYATLKSLLRPNWAALSEALFQDEFQ